MIIVIAGPTGVGKTKMSIELAKLYNGEVINADSTQVYKEMNIGTAKVTEKEKDGIVHHLIDIKDITDNYTVYDYQKDCRQVIDDILSRGKTPILVGGTGLYIKAALYNYTFEKEESNEIDYSDFTNEELYSKLLEIDKDTDIHMNNRKRIIRALNYYNNHKQSISNNKDGNNLLYNDVLFIGLTTDRELLYKRINDRVDIMLNEGLIEEAKYFYDKKINSKAIMTPICYKELFEYFNNNCDLNTAIELIKQRSRRYAKRQYTFFNHQLPVKWFNVDFNNFNNTVNEVSEYIKKAD